MSQYERVDLLALADQLDNVREHQFCAYLAENGERCDCKFRPSPISLKIGMEHLNSETTGCCEMRTVVDLLRDLGGDQSKPRLPGHVRGSA